MCGYFNNFHSNSFLRWFPGSHRLHFSLLSPFSVSGRWWWRWDGTGGWVGGWALLPCLWHSLKLWRVCLSHSYPFFPKPVSFSLPGWDRPASQPATRLLYLIPNSIPAPMRLPSASSLHPSFGDGTDETFYALCIYVFLSLSSWRDRHRQEALTALEETGATYMGSGDNPPYQPSLYFSKIQTFCSTKTLFSCILHLFLLFLIPGLEDSSHMGHIFYMHLIYLLFIFISGLSVSPLSGGFPSLTWTQCSVSVSCVRKGLDWALA